MLCKVKKRHGFLLLMFGVYEAIVCNMGTAVRVWGSISPFPLKGHSSSHSVPLPIEIKQNFTFVVRADNRGFYCYARSISGTILFSQSFVWRFVNYAEMRSVF